MLASSSHPATSSSLAPDFDVTTTASSERRADESLKVLPLAANKTNPSNDKDDLTTMTSSTQSPMTVNSFDAKIEPEIIRSEGTTGQQLVSNESDNQANQPQTELAEADDKSREKEGRAINFPSGVGSNQASSTVPAHMSGSINFVTTSTEKTHVMSFFDLSDVSMDHDDGNNEHREMDAKGMKTTTDKQTAGHVIINNGCENNGSSYKASFTRNSISNESASSVCIRNSITSTSPSPTTRLLWNLAVNSLI